MEGQTIQKTDSRIGNNRRILKLTVLTILTVSLIGNVILGLTLIDRYKVKQVKQPAEVTADKQEEAKNKLLTLTSYNGVSFQYPNGWQIVDEVFLNPSKGDWMETEREEVISINKERNHRWGPFGVATDATLVDMILKDQNIRAEDYAEKFYKNIAEKNSLGDVKLMNLSKQISPAGLIWWKLQYENPLPGEVSGETSFTSYFLEYTKTINQVNLGTIEIKKHIIQLSGGGKDIPESLEMRDQIIKTLKVPTKDNKTTK